jgi:hypothetical protein
LRNALDEYIKKLLDIGETKNEWKWKRGLCKQNMCILYKRARVC